MIITTDAIVLKSFNYRETSCIATFFTKDHGKVSGILKGIRKDPKKFGSSIDKFTVNHMVYYQYNRSDLHLVSQCDLTHFFFPIRQDYKRNLAANYALELVDLVMPAEQKNRKIYNLLLRYLNALESVKDIDQLVHVFQIKILQLSGFSPHLDSCVKTGEPIKGRARFSMMLGGLVGPDVDVSGANSVAISKGSISSILHIERESWENALRLGLTKAVRKELKFILNNFLVYHLERKIKSAKFLT